MTEETTNKATATTTATANAASAKSTELPFARGSLTPSMFLALYSAFLHAFHADPPASADAKQKAQCKIADHLLKFEHPPSFEGKSFNIFDFFRLIISLGGFQHTCQMKSWTDICRRIGMNPSKSNISTRIRDWAEKHHIVAFFDFLLGIPHDFYRPLRDDEIVGPKSVQKDGFPVLETESEMWLRLYGLDGGESSRWKTVAPIIHQQTPINHSFALKRDRDLNVHEDYCAGTMAPRKRRYADSSDKIVIIGGVPMAALSIAEQKVLAEVHVRIKTADVLAACNSSNTSLENNGNDGNGLGGHISTKEILVAGGELVVPSAENRLAALKSDLEKFKALSLSQNIRNDTRNLTSPAGENSGEQGNAEVDLKEENTKLKQDIAQLVNLLKAQQSVLDNLRRRIIHIE